MVMVINNVGIQTPQLFILLVLSSLSTPMEFLNGLIYLGYQQIRYQYRIHASSPPQTNIKERYFSKGWHLLGSLTFRLIRVTNILNRRLTFPKNYRSNREKQS